MWQGPMLKMNPQQNNLAAAPVVLSLLWSVSMSTHCTAACVRWSSRPCATGAAPETGSWQVTAACGRCPCTPLQSTSWRAWERGCWLSVSHCLCVWWPTPCSSTYGSWAGEQGWGCWGPVPGTTPVIGTTWEDWWLWSTHCPGLWQLL